MTTVSLQKSLEMYVETATTWGKMARPAQVRAGAKKLIRSGKLPVEFANAIRQPSTGQVGQQSSGA